jgi:acyl CoA:acetate/3-ketoacid CoA transferase beta subunit
VNRLITEYAVFDFPPDKGITLVRGSELILLIPNLITSQIEISDDITLEQLRKITGTQFHVSPNLKKMQFADV